MQVRSRALQRWKLFVMTPASVTCASPIGPELAARALKVRCTWVMSPRHELPLQFEPLASFVICQWSATSRGPACGGTGIAPLALQTPVPAL